MACPCQNTIIPTISNSLGNCDPCNQLAPCVETNCACPLLIKSDCVNNVTVDLPCLNVAKGKTLNEFLLAIDLSICAKLARIVSNFILKNVGIGVGKLYKGISILGEKEIKSIKAGNLITVNNLPDEVEVLVDSTALNLLIPTATNVGTGLGEVFKNKVGNILNLRKIKTDNTGTGANILNVETTDLINDNVVISAKTLKTENLGITGESILKTVVTNINDLTIQAKKIDSKFGGLNVTTSVDGNTIYIDTPTDESIKAFYVNQNFTGTSNGSLAKPYKKLVDALVAAIGTGTLIQPQFNGASIIVQTNLNVVALDFTNNPILEGRLSVNTISIIGEGNDNKSITINNTIDYPFDTNFLYIKVLNTTGLDTNADLFYDLGIYLQNLWIKVSTKGVLNNEVHIGSNIVGKPSSSVKAVNVKFQSLYAPTSSYTVAKNYDGSNVFSFGTIVKVQDSIVVDTPHLQTKGKTSALDGNFNLINCSIVATNQVALKIENSVINLDKISITYPATLVNVQNATITTGKYLPKSDINDIEIVNSFVQLFEYNNQVQYASSKNSTLVDNIVGGNNNVFNLSGATPILIVRKGFVYNLLTNYILTLNPTSSAQLINCDFTNAISQIKAFKSLTGSSVGVSLEGSQINNVESTLISNVNLYSNNAIINNYSFSSKPGFANDSQAILNGLIQGSIYYNTTTSALKQVV